MTNVSGPDSKERSDGVSPRSNALCDADLVVSRQLDTIKCILSMVKAFSPVPLQTAYEVRLSSSCVLTPPQKKNPLNAENYQGGKK